MHNKNQRLVNIELWPFQLIVLLCHLSAECDYIFYDCTEGISNTFKSYTTFWRTQLQDSGNQETNSLSKYMEKMFDPNSLQALIHRVKET